MANKNQQPRNKDGKFAKLPSKEELMKTISDLKEEVKKKNDIIREQRNFIEGQDNLLKETRDHVSFLLNRASWWTMRLFKKEFPL